MITGIHKGTRSKPRCPSMATRPPVWPETRPCTASSAPFAMAGAVVLVRWKLGHDIVSEDPVVLLTMSAASSCGHRDRQRRHEISYSIRCCAIWIFFPTIAIPAMPKITRITWVSCRLLADHADPRQSPPPSRSHYNPITTLCHHNFPKNETRPITWARMRRASRSSHSLLHKLLPSWLAGGRKTYDDRLSQ